MNYDPDVCYECTGYGDDWYTTEDGELVSACDGCHNNPFNEDDDDD